MRWSEKIRRFLIQNEAKYGAVLEMMRKEKDGVDCPYLLMANLFSPQTVQVSSAHDDLERTLEAPA